MKEVVTKILLIAVAVAAVVTFIYGAMWTETEKIKDSTITQIQDANASALPSN